MWRCKTCIGGLLHCARCLKNSHRLLWYHRVERWNGSYFQIGALWQVGITLNLGHNGQHCPRTIITASADIPEQLPSFQNLTPGDLDATHSLSVPPDQLWTTNESIIHFPNEIHPLEIQPDDGDDSYDNVNDDMNNALPKMFPKPGLMDMEGNCYVTIVDVSGIHYLASIPCICSSALDQDAQYLDLGLLSASYKDVKTVFTLTVLKDFRLSNLECKTTAYQYYQKLRRLTCPSFPWLIPNQYAELRRASRQYRDLKKRQIYGIAHGVPQTKGSMALFCTACPQHGINLKDDWKADPNRNLYIRNFVSDGNFKADHVKQKNINDDVYLSSGEGYMTEPNEYAANVEEMVKIAPRFKRVRYLSHFCSLSFAGYFTCEDPGSPVSLWPPC